MKAKHHFWSSAAVGAGLYWITGSSTALTGAMIGGFVIDADHVIDQLWSIRKGAPLLRKSAPLLRQSGVDEPSSTGLVQRYFLRRKLLRLPLIFHSYELMCVLAAVTVLLRTPFLIGLLSGYVLHLSLDLVRHYDEFQSPFFYLISYRLSQGFRRERLIKPEYL
jgi:hypothetical protein